MNLNFFVIKCTKKQGQQCLYTTVLTVPAEQLFSHTGGLLISRFILILTISTGFSVVFTSIFDKIKSLLGYSLPLFLLDLNCYFPLYPLDFLSYLW